MEKGHYLFHYICRWSKI